VQAIGVLLRHEALCKWPQTLKVLLLKIGARERESSVCDGQTQFS